LNAAGSALVYSTYLSGSSGLNWGTGIAVDATGNAYVTGSTNCSDFPTTPGAFETIWGVSREAFVTKLNAAGSALVYSTYMGGATDTWGLGIAVDASGSAYVTGETLPSDFPTTPGAFQTSLAGTDDAFVAKLNAAGSALVYSTYLGGSGSEFGYGIAVDATGNAYVTGYTSSSDFPTTPGAFPTGITAGGPTEYDAFVTKLNVAGSALVYSTYLGGSNYDYGTGIAVAAAGNTYVAGVTYSSDFPTVNPLQSNCDNCVAATTSDAIVAKISPADVPGVSLTPANLTFAGQTVGLTSSPQIVTLRNVGSAPLSIDRIFANGDFAQTNTCASDILGGGSCTIEVTFTRTATGTRTGSITITDNAAGNPHTVSLTGLETNPLPSLTALSPSSATAGGAAFTLTVNGTNFVSESVVGWNGADRITTYSSSAQLTASIPASDISTGGTAQVTVFNPAPGGGTSNSLNFTINPLGNPVPTLASLVPSSATAGGAAFSLAVYGTNFISGSIVRWGGADRTTTYSSSTQLTASITAADIATGGTVAVTVFNPAPGGGSSNAVTFNINIPDFSLSKDPSSATVTAGQTAEYTLTVTPLGGFNQSVSLSCSGALSAATCSVSPTSVTPDGTNNATATVRITTTARSIAPPSLPLGPPSLGLRLPTLLFLMLITVMLLAIAAGRQRARFRLIVALAALVLVSALVACGGGGNGGGGFTPPAGTLAGTYTLTITATSGSLSHNTTVSLTVN
jgi:hypothetical protein